MISFGQACAGEAIAKLAPYLQSSNPWLKEGAIHGLRATQSPVAIEPLKKAVAAESLDGFGNELRLALQALENERK